MKKIIVLAFISILPISCYKKCDVDGCQEVVNNIITEFKPDTIGAEYTKMFALSYALKHLEDEHGVTMYGGGNFIYGVMRKADRYSIDYLPGSKIYKDSHILYDKTFEEVYNGRK